MKESASEQSLIQCETCLKEVPAEDAESAETAEYVAHFCGLECYQQWHEKHPSKETKSE